MRILHLDSGREMRGGQWQVLRLHAGLLRRGHDSVLAARENGPLLNAVRSAGLPCEPLRALRLGIRSRGFDIVHAHDARTHTLGALLARAPLVVSRRVAFPVQTSAASRWKYRKAALYLAVSQFVARELGKAGVERGRIRIVYDGVPLSALTASGNRVLSIQKIAPIVDGLAEPVRDFYADLAQASALIYLTDSEGLGSGILLAMAWGVPVIASNIGGIPEIITDGINGILIPNQREAIRDALSRMTPAMGRAARRTIEERFSEDTMVEATIAAYAGGSLIILLAGLFGLLIGSFLNVCIYRWPRDLSVVRPRSHCPECEAQIAWYDNIPLASFVILRGRCRHCHAAISWRYPLVELLTALAFGYFVFQYGPTLAAVKYCVFSALLIGLIFSDVETLLLPDEMTLGGAVIGLVFAWFVPIPGGTTTLIAEMAGFNPSAHSATLLEAFGGAFLPAGILWLAGWVFEKVRHKEGLGFGDVKMLAMIGAFLGLRGSLQTIILGSLLGSVIGLMWIKAKGEDAATFQLPFGSFLGASALIVGLWGQHVAGWYSLAFR